MTEEDKQTLLDIRRMLDSITPPDPDGFYSVAKVSADADPVELYRQSLAMGSGPIWYVGTEKVATAITGNGPHSRGNAEFYAAAPNLVRWLLQFAERAEALALELDHLRPEWQAMAAERDQLRAALAAATARVEAAEAQRDALGTELNINTDLYHAWESSAEEQRQRAEAAEANARQWESTAREYSRVQEHTKKRAEAAEGNAATSDHYARRALEAEALIAPLQERCELLGRALLALWSLVGEQDQQAITALLDAPTSSGKTLAAGALVEMLERRAAVNGGEV